MNSTHSMTLRRCGAALALSILAAAHTVAQQPSDRQPDASAILDEIDAAFYPPSFFVRMHLSSEMSGRSAEMTIESLHLSGVGSIMEIIEPRRSAGTRFLSVDETLWMYNPRGRGTQAIRLSPRDSFQGTVFANNDVADAQFADDYTAEYVERRRIDHPTLGATWCHVIDAVASDREATYGRVRLIARESDLAPLRIEYFAHTGLLYKTMELDGFDEVAGRVRPTVWTMLSHEQEGAFTVVTVEELEERADLDATDFTQRALTRQR